MEKECFKCNQVKPLSEFHRHVKMADGHLNKRKEYAKQDVRQHRMENDSVKEYDRNRPNKRERSLKAIARTREQYFNDPEFKKKHRESKIRWKENNPDKRSAQCAANNAVRDGRLERKFICEYCGSSERLQKHHWSYERQHWLDVVWLCSICHGVEHARLNEEGRCPDSKVFKR